ncbi:glycosyltransferase [Marinobacterium sedimentorum]|uniref:glycosyltransferase n=1 Tax=Marinobacterium sedimentorum TaxID=2927804 RepID=UPI0020C60FF0|nr:glycosyltransferase [Marinobacterium sedimentorum]MCP8688669.1 glycosyltransferase [Marinobacterium sedimentorum]
MRFKERFILLGGEVLLGSLWLSKILLKAVGYTRIHSIIVLKLIRRNNIFDADYYIENNPDVAGSGISPMRHYAIYGDREGRTPSAIFDPNYYRSRAEGRTKHVNALLHYLYVGRYKRISPSPWFDVNYYLSQNKDVARSGYEPLKHYLSFGGLEGRSPNPQFDGSFYLRENPEVVQARLNPLLHYLLVGRKEGIPTRPLKNYEPTISTPVIDINSDECWEEINRSRFASVPEVDVVIPVYRDMTLTLRCIHSVLISLNKTPYELIVINDSSPEPELVSILKNLAAKGLFTLLHNADNKGFVETVNRGMKLHLNRDVVLVNSDTEVYNNWLDRLRNAALDKRVASVTPLSNNATICSYPRFLHDNPYPLETPYATLDSIAAQINCGLSAEAPTAVGFCMYISRGALDEIGFFDEKTFGKGYGEENDWCQRAIALGWKNLITTDTYVRHFGSASFQGEKGKRVENAMKIINRLYPGYNRDVQRFIQDDPLKIARRNLDWARLKSYKRNENVLIVCHNRGGGAERHVQEDAQMFGEQGKGVFFLRPERGSPEKVRLGHPACRQLLNMPLFDLADTESLSRALAELGISVIHSHGLVDLTAEAPDHLLALVQYLEIPLHVDIHDYKVVCPRINLISANDQYCGEPGEKICNECLVKNGNDFGVKNIVEWRDRHHNVLRQAAKILVPDQDVISRLNKYYPDVIFHLEPHSDIDKNAIKIIHPDINHGENLRIVVIGAISKIKGYRVLKACAEDARKRKLPLEFIVMGFSHNDRLLERAGVKVTGSYLDGEAQSVLKNTEGHVVWLPSIWPETYSYTLSIALKNNLPVFAFDFGAIAQRLNSIGEISGLMAMTVIDSPVSINNLFIQYRQSKLGSVK